MLQFLKNIFRHLIPAGKRNVRCPFCCNSFKASRYLFRCESYKHGRNNPHADLTTDEKPDKDKISDQFKVNTGESYENDQDSNNSSVFNPYENIDVNIWEAPSPEANKTNEMNFCKPENDEKMDRIWGVKTPLGRVVTPVKETPEGQKEYLGHLVEFPCPECGYNCTVKICPHCHHVMSDTDLLDDIFIITLIGATNSGKSNFISVLLYKMIQDGFGTNVGLDFRTANDATRKKTEEDYLTAFKDSSLVFSTKSVETSKAIKEPLIFVVGTKKQPIFGGEVTVSNQFTLVVYDVAGEDLVKTDVLDEDLQHILKSDAYIFLIDPMEIKIVTDKLKEPPPKGGMDFTISLMLDSLIQRISKKNKLFGSKKINKSVAVVLSKMDKINSLITEYKNLSQSHTHVSGFDTQDFEVVNKESLFLLQQMNYGQICKKISAQFSNVAFFAVSALGGDPKFVDNKQKISELKPKRLEDPFLWLLYKAHKMKAAPPPQIFK